MVATRQYMIDLIKMIKGKEAIVGNTKYPWEDDYKYIGLNIDGDYKELYVTEREDLLVIQISIFSSTG